MALKPLMLAAALGALALPASAAGKSDPHDITGTWERYPVAGDARRDTTLAAPPPEAAEAPLKPQYIEAYRAQVKATAAAFARGEPPDTNYVKCLPDGMPTMMQGMFPMEVLQTRGQVTIIQEAYNQVRRIYLDEKQLPIEDAEPEFWGHSVGRWDGDTLVVDTVGIKENVRYKNAPHSDQMRIAERIKKLSDDMFQDQITVTDPVYLTGPWSWTYMYKRKPGYKINEYVCEDNRLFGDSDTGAQRLRLLPTK